MFTIAAVHHESTFTTETCCDAQPEVALRRMRARAEGRELNAGVVGCCSRPSASSGRSEGLSPSVMRLKIGAALWVRSDIRCINYCRMAFITRLLNNSGLSHNAQVCARSAAPCGSVFLYPRPHPQSSMLLARFLATHGWRKDALFDGMPFFCNRATSHPTAPSHSLHPHPILVPMFFVLFTCRASFVCLHFIFHCIPFSNAALALCSLPLPSNRVRQAALGVGAFVAAGYIAAQSFHQVPPLVKKSRFASPSARNLKPKALFCSCPQSSQVQVPFVALCRTTVLLSDIVVNKCHRSCCLRLVFFHIDFSLISPPFPLACSSRKWMAARQGPSGNPITHA
jgi:hypothetical protein